MSEVTGEPLRVEEIEAIGAALLSLPDALGNRVIAGIACAAALGARIQDVREGDSVVPNSMFKTDRADVKERYKADVMTSVARRMSLDEPESQAAHSEVRSRLTWLSLSSDLEHFQRKVQLPSN